MSLEAMKQHGAFSWNELMTSDIDAAKQFYSELLGWSLQDVDMGGMTYTLAKVGDTEVAGMLTTPPEAGNLPPSWGSYVTVDNIDERVARAEALGAKICFAPQDIPNLGRFAIVTDPQGAMLAMITYFDKE